VRAWWAAVIPGYVGQVREGAERTEREAREVGEVMGVAA
jgi:hypothetical protein